MIYLLQLLPLINILHPSQNTPAYLIYEAFPSHFQQDLPAQTAINNKNISCPLIYIYEYMNMNMNMNSLFSFFLGFYLEWSFLQHFPEFTDCVYAAGVYRRHGCSYRNPQMFQMPTNQKKKQYGGFQDKPVMSKIIHLIMLSLLSFILSSSSRTHLSILQESINQSIK